VTVSVLIPWRTDHGQRERLFDYLLPLWRATGLEICVGSDDGLGPFNRSQALNRAFATSTGATMVVYDADCVPDPTRIANLSGTAPWERLYAHTEYLSRADTDAVLDGLDPWEPTPEYTVDMCGLIAVNRDCWTEIGGADEQFRGWGGEDVALYYSLARKYGPSPEPTSTLRCLWHEIADRSGWPINHRRLTDVYGLT
jgi:hypothetical protein